MMRLRYIANPWAKRLTVGLMLVSGLLWGHPQADGREREVPVGRPTEQPAKVPTGAVANEAWRKAIAGISGSRVRGHIEILADDAMEGRETGTPGFQMAAEYVAAEFESLGLVPAGGGGGYLQPIAFFESTLVPTSAAFHLHRAGDTVELVFGEDFVQWAGFGSASDDITAPLVFVGHGVRAPEYEYDDLAGVDLGGKIAVVLSGAPPFFDTDQRAYYSSGRVKRTLATELGAVGIVTVRTPVDENRYPWERLLTGVDRAEMCWIDAEGRPFEGFQQLRGDAALSPSGAEKLFAVADRDLVSIFELYATESGGESSRSSFDMGVTATLRRSSRHGTIESSNVVGLLPGSDPKLRDEYVVFTAHLDHLGVRSGENGKEIYNGAYDNAAGVGAILEIARAMSSLEPAPRRSVLFVALTAEEKGLQGSTYFAHHPPIAAGRIVANLNIDMPYLGFPVADLEAFGAEHSTLKGPVAAAAESLGLTLTPDSMPEQVRFVRSDQFSFVQRGIPALAFKPGSRSFDPAMDGTAELRVFLDQHYHRPSDDLNLPYSPEGAEAFVRTVLLTGLLVADADERPRWNEGDFFALEFAREDTTRPPPERTVR